MDFPYVHLARTAQPRSGTIRAASMDVRMLLSDRLNIQKKFSLGFNGTNLFQFSNQLNAQKNLFFEHLIFLVDNSKLKSAFVEKKTRLGSNAHLEIFWGVSGYTETKFFFLGVCGIEPNFDFLSPLSLFPFEIK